MDVQLNENIVGVLERIKPSLGGADIRLESVKQGVVTLKYYKPLANPSACHVDRTKPTKDIIIEILEEELKDIINDTKLISGKGCDFSFVEFCDDFF